MIEDHVLWSDPVRTGFLGRKRYRIFGCDECGWRFWQEGREARWREALWHHHREHGLQGA